MDKKSKYFLVALFGVIFIIIIYSFYKYFYITDYDITVKVDCDPKQEECLLDECDPEDGDCAESGAKYYKLIEKKASEIEK